MIVFLLASSVVQARAKHTCSTSHVGCDGCRWMGHEPTNESIPSSIPSSPSRMQGDGMDHLPRVRNGRSAKCYERMRALTSSHHSSDGSTHASSTKSTKARKRKGRVPMSSVWTNNAYKFVVDAWMESTHVKGAKHGRKCEEQH